MEKRSDVSSDSGARIKTSEEKIEKAPKLKSKKNLTVLVRNLYPAIVRVAGQSGKEYVFRNAGAEVKVDEEDVEQLLAKRRGGCCGGGKSPMFELV